MQTDLYGKVVVITGASGGIGSAIARRFAAEGARLVLHYNRDRASALKLQNELAGQSIANPGNQPRLDPATRRSGSRRSHEGRLYSSPETLLVQADLSSEAATIRLFRQAIRRFGRVDSLIANAGSWEIEDVPLHRMSLRHWRRTMDGVLTTTFLTVREFLRLVAKQKQGNAILIASTAAVFGEAGHADYASAKAAIAYGLTRTLKNEISRIAPHTRTYCGGRVNCISPGWTVVPRSAARLSNRKTIQKVTATMALPQIGRPDDMAHAAVFLSSDTLARHITGQTLVIAGGMEGRQLWQPGEIETAIV